MLTQTECLKKDAIEKAITFIKTTGGQYDDFKHHTLGFNSKLTIREFKKIKLLISKNNSYESVKKSKCLYQKVVALIINNCRTI